MPDGSLVLLLVNLLDQPRALTLSLPAPAGDGEAVAEAWVIFEQNRRIDVSTRIFCWHIRWHRPVILATTQQRP